MRTARTVLLLTALAAPALAQRPPQGGPPPGAMPGMGEPPRLLLLSQKSVQDDLQLDKDQVRDVNAALRKLQQDLMTTLKGTALNAVPAQVADLHQQADKAVDALLKPEQTKRLKQITLQMRGGRALLDPAVAETLELTTEQKQQLNTFQEKTQRQEATLMQAGPSGFQRLEQLHKTAGERMLTILTTEQKPRWEELTGKPFKGDLRLGPPGLRPPGQP